MVYVACVISTSYYSFVCLGFYEFIFRLAHCAANAVATVSSDIFKNSNSVVLLLGVSASCQTDHSVLSAQQSLRKANILQHSSSFHLFQLLAPAYKHSAWNSGFISILKKKKKSQEKFVFIYVY